MITGKIIGTEAVVTRIRGIYPSLRNELKQYCLKFAINTRQYVQAQKLSGQVLHHRTGTLKDKTYYDVRDKGSAISAIVGNSAEYARIHEFGGRTKPHVITAKNGGALHFMKGGKDVFARSVNHPGSVMPERSFLRTTLAERIGEFRAGLKLTTERVITR